MNHTDVDELLTNMFSDADILVGTKEVVAMKIAKNRLLALLESEAEGTAVYTQCKGLETGCSSFKCVGHQKVINKAVPMSAITRLFGGDTK